MINYATGLRKYNIMIGDNISNTMRGLDGADQRIGGEGHDNMSGDGPADYMLRGRRNRHNEWGQW